MRYILALFLPWLSLMFQGKIGAGIVCLLLQISLIGWIPATIWAITSLNRMYADRRNEKLIKAMSNKEK